MHTQKKRLGDILIDCNLISQEQLQQALTYQKEKALKLGEALIEKSFVTEDDIIWALGNQLNISFIHLNPDIVDQSVVSMVTPEFAKEHKLLPLYKAGNELNVCMVDPLDTRPTEFLEDKYGVTTAVSICTLFDFEQTYNAVYGPMDIQSKVPTNEVDSREAESLESGIPKGMEAPEKVINYILSQAITTKVDYIHFEPTDKGVAIRFRTNNVLKPKIEIPLKVHYEIIARLKKISHLPESEVQDHAFIGHFRVTISNRQINIQSIFYPTINGEMAILKLNDFGTVLDQLGHNVRKSIEKVARTLHTTHGVLYISGAHESGKTTTSYAILSTYEASSNKVVTVESPVIVTLPRTTQIQIGSPSVKNELEGLKLAFLLDADVVYVDNVTTPKLLNEIAFAGLGGKTIITSVLAFDVASTIVSLIKLSDNLVVFASSVCGFLCQRLIRVLCRNCSQVTETPEALKPYLEKYSDIPEFPKVYKAVGCESCNKTGYSDKTLISEFLPDSPELRQMIISESTYQDFYSFARKQGIKSLEERALELLLAGETSIEEFLRLF